MDQSGNIIKFPKIDSDLNEKFIKERPKEAEKLFNSLSLKEQLDLVLKRNYRERLSLIELSHRSQSLVRSIPEPELYLTIKQLGEEESLPILALASQKQLTYIFDLEFWQEQSLSPDRICHWLDLLRKADEEQFREWLKKCDEELLVSVLQRLIQVYVADPDNLGAEPWRDKNFFTLDEQYYIEILDERFQVIVERLLAHLRDLEQKKFYTILDRVRMTIALENEDTAYRVRNGRLEDYGFYDFDEAFKIYRFLSPERLKVLDGKPEKLITPKQPALRYPLMLFEKIPSFLKQAISDLSPEELERFCLELATLINKLMIADVMDLTNLDNIRKALEKAYGYLEIGLESWSQERREKAVEILKNQWLEHIFQAGFSQVLGLRFRAQRIERMEWFKFVGKPYHIFGELEGKRIKALLYPRPKFYTEKAEAGEQEFRNLAEVKLVESAVVQAETIIWLFFERLGLEKETLKSLIINYPFELDFKVILATALVNGVTTTKMSFEPVELEQVKRFIMQSMIPSSPPKKIETGLKEEFINWLIRRAGEEAGSEKKALIQKLAESALVNIEEELGVLENLESIDQRFIGSVMIKKID